MKQMKSDEILKNERNSGIELLKVISIFLIVLNHVVQTLSQGNKYIDFQDYVVNISRSTTEAQILLLAILRYSGCFGNLIFFVCSAWFLLEKKDADKKKWWFMLLEIWTISAIITVVTYILRAGGGENFDATILKMSLFPTTYATNWYMTCYLLFYPIHPTLNKIISDMSQKTLLKTATLLFVLYFIINFFTESSLFFASALIEWITIYFVVAYIKKYLKDFFSNTMANVSLLLNALMAHVGIILAINFLGLSINRYSNKLMYWKKDANLFLFLAAVALVNLMQKVKWKNALINHVSKLSMLIYIIHENIILRTYYRPWLINYIYENYGYEHVVLWMIFLALIIFLVSACIGFLYEKTIQKGVKRVSEKLCTSSHRLYEKYESIFLPNSPSNGKSP